MSINIESVNIRQVERRLGSMKQKAPKVMKLAVNDTARKARSRLAKEAQKKYAVKTAGFNRVMKIKFASASNIAAVIHARGEKIPLYKFAHRSGTLGSEVYYNPTLHRYQDGKGGTSASGKQLKSSGFKSSTSAKLKWFIANTGKHTGIFVRNAGVKRHEGSRGNPEISEKMGASVPEMIGNEKRVYGIVRPYIQSDLQKAVSRHIMRAFRGEI